MLFVQYKLYYSTWPYHLHLRPLIHLRYINIHYSLFTRSPFITTNNKQQQLVFTIYTQKKTIDDRNLDFSRVRGWDKVANTQCFVVISYFILVGVHCILMFLVIVHHSIIALFHADEQNEALFWINFEFYASAKSDHWFWWIW